MCFQRTIQVPISASGIGVHSGKDVLIKFVPAPANTGIIFKRIDLDPTIEIPAKSEFVTNTIMSTCISKGTATVNTIEHLVSAVYGLGIDNLIIEINSAEVPIMDGSAAPFIFILKSAGIVTQTGHLKKFIKITKPISVTTDDKSATIEPFDGFKLDMQIEFEHPSINNSNNSVTTNFSSTSFIHDISQARTFGFLADIEKLKQQNLALGGSLDNCIVLDDTRVINEKGLRFEDELVRHKVLDAIGDLYLLGMPLIGHFKGFKSGHKLNDMLLKAISATTEGWEIVTFNSDQESPIKFA